MAIKKETRKTTNLLYFRAMIIAIVIFFIGFGSYLVGVKKGIEKQRQIDNTNIPTSEITTLSN